MNTLVLCVGLPRSGKSTWSKEQGHPIVCPDAIRLALHGQPFIGLAEPFVWAIAKVMARALFLAGHSTVILDSTNTTKKRRDEWKSDNWIRKYEIFTLGKEPCKQRVLQSGATEEHKLGLIEAIERMTDQYEPITPEEQDT